MNQDTSQLFIKVVSAIANAADEAKFAALNNLEASLKTRIFNDGRNSGGGSIGSYSTRPMYVSIAGAKAKYGSQLKSSALTAVGKNGATQFKNGKKRKSQYFADGYAGFRAQVGRQNQKVDLNLTGNLQDSLQGGVTNKGLALAFINSKSSRLSQDLEDKYGDVFTPTDEEVEEVLTTIEETIFDAITQALG
jgi:hypothetical protein